MQTLRRCELLLGLVTLFGFVQVAPARAFETKLPSGWSLTIEVPSGWHVEEDSGPLSVTLRLFTSKQAEHPTVQITAFALPPGQPAHTPDEVRALVEKGGRGILDSALQTSLEISPLELSAGSAFYYHLTDRHEERNSGDFRELHQGLGEASGHLFTFTVLTHPGEDALVATSLNALSTILLAKK
jgi:hypothetical protein